MKSYTAKLKECPPRTELSAQMMNKNLSQGHNNVCFRLAESIIYARKEW